MPEDSFYETKIEIIEVTGGVLQEINFGLCKECTHYSPGYWKNHPDAWTVEEIEIGGITYTKAEAIMYMQAPVAGDKTHTLFRALVAAKLNGGVCCGCPEIGMIIDDADAWMAENGPVGVGVAANSDAWKESGKDLYEELEDFNDGDLCDDNG